MNRGHWSLPVWRWLCRPFAGCHLDKAMLAEKLYWYMLSHLQREALQSEPWQQRGWDGTSPNSLLTLKLGNNDRKHEELFSAEGQKGEHFWMNRRQILSRKNYCCWLCPWGRSPIVLHKASRLSTEQHQAQCNSVASNRLWNKTFPMQHSADSLFLFSCFSLSFWLLPCLFPHFVSCARFLLVPLCPFSARSLKQARPKFGLALPLLRRSKSVPDSPLAPSSGHGSSRIPKASTSVGILTESLVNTE